MMENSFEDRYTKKQLDRFVEINDVLKHIAGCTIEEFGDGARRDRLTVLYRTFYCYYARTAGMSFWDIADKCNFRSHASAVYQYKIHKERLTYDELYRTIHEKALVYCSIRKNNWIERNY